MTQLFDAQRALRLAARGSAKWCTMIESLQRGVPPPILAHFLRNLAVGRQGVALVRHGVCSECHIRVPSALLPLLVNPHDVHLCEQCGCYLLLPLDEITPADEPHHVPAAQTERGRKSRRAVAV